MATDPPSPQAAAPWRGTIIVTSFFVLMLVVMVTVMSLTLGTTSLEGGYFFDHDAYLLVASGLALLLMLRLPIDAPPLQALSQRQTAMLALFGAVIAYACCNLVFRHYAISRDEQSAEFAATYLAAGKLGWAIPHRLRDLGLAMMPIHTMIRPDTWTSSYLPVNAAFRAITARVAGDQWLASPLLLAIGVLALAASARRIWPDRGHATTVAVAMALSSTQVMMTAATPFAMTGHFALNALWIACFLRGGRMGHGCALTIGLLATGLHQAHFHITLVLCFAFWLASERRWRLAGTYVLACLCYWIVWRHMYPLWLNWQLGRPVATQAIAAYDASSIISRLGQLQPGESLARFIAWQNPLLLPLAITGSIAAFRAEGPNRVLVACAIACLSGLAMLIQQDHGFGYRYLHHLIPCFCLLAAGGWLALEDKLTQRLSGTILLASIAFAALITLPVATWRTMAAAAPYRNAYHAVRAADADYLLVDARAGAYLQDIVRFERDNDGPVILDLGYVPASALAHICAHSRVMLFGSTQARHFGIPVDPYRVANAEQTAARATRLRQLGCGQPMPLLVEG